MTAKISIAPWKRDTAAIGAHGATCDASHPCLATLRCDGTCQAQLGEGEPCKNLTGDCDLYTQGLACVAGTCKKIAFASRKNTPE